MSARQKTTKIAIENKAVASWKKSKRTLKKSIKTIAKMRNKYKETMEKNIQKIFVEKCWQERIKMLSFRTSTKANKTYRKVSLKEK